MSTGTQYFVSPMQPGVRPADPPDYDGITFVYLFTNVLDPWIVPAQLQNVVLVVANAQGFAAGMSIIIEGAGSFQVVSTDALNRMTVQNLGYVSNAAPGTSIAPGKITTTSLPGPKGDQGIQGVPGLAATVDVGTTITSPAGQNANVVNAGTNSAAILNFTIPRGPVGPQGAQGAPGQAYNNTTTADFNAANAPTAQTLSLQSTTGLFAGVTLNINPIGYYKVTQVLSGTQVSVVNTGTASNAAPGTLAPSGSPVLGTGPEGPPGNPGAPGAQGPAGANGAPGAQGPAGADGAPGAPGAAATLTAGTTTTGAPGTQATVTAVGTPQAQVFNFQIPQGATGSQGAPGAAGATGPQGPAGAAGAAATLTAGTTSTLAPGSNAAVTAVGTTSAQIFNFAIPRGDVGATGTNGLDSVTTTSASFTVPAVGATVTVNVANASWITLGQMVYVQGAGGTNLSGALQVTGISGNQLTLLNPNPPPAIPNASTAGPGLLATLSGNVTDYVGGDNICHSIASISAFVTKTAAYTLTAADSGKYVICSGGSWTLTLPAPVVGLNYRLRNDMGISGTTGTITLQPTGGTVDGQASIPLLPQQECTLITDGTNWRTFGLRREVILGTQDITTSTASGTVLLPVGFRYFELNWEGLVPVTTGNNLVFRLSINGGSTWITTATYFFSNIYISGTNTVSGSTQTAGASSANIGSATSNALNQGSTFTLSLWPGNASQNARWRSQGGSWNTFEASTLNTGMLNAGGVTNALSYFFGAGGNIANSFLTVKGVV
jgi:hypothetical protein